MKLYHFDLRANVESIQRDGFHDGDVWLSDLSLLDDANPPLGHEFAQVVVDAPEDLDRYEVIGNPLVRPGSHREWCIPAQAVNAWPRKVEYR
jgi:hypothetical protein